MTMLKDPIWPLLAVLMLIAGACSEDADDEPQEAADAGGSVDADAGTGCLPRNGAYAGPWEIEFEEGPCAMFPDYVLAGDRLIWNISGDGKGLEVQTFKYAGTFDETTCVAEFVDRQPGATFTFLFDFTTEPVIGRFNLDRQQAGQTCVRQWRGELKSLTKRPLPESEPVALGGKLNEWGLAFDPRIHVADGGGAVATWREWNSFDGKSDLLARVFDPQTGTFGTVSELDDNDEVVEHYSSAGTASGAVVVAWVQYDTEGNNGGGKSIYSNVYLPGQGFTGPHALERIDEGTTLADVGALSVAATDTSQGVEAVVTYLQGPRLEERYVNVARYRGGTWQESQVVGAAYAQSPELWTSAINSAGELVVLLHRGGYLDGSTGSFVTATVEIVSVDASGAATVQTPDGMGSVPQVDGMSAIALPDDSFLVLTSWRDGVPPNPPTTAVVTVTTVDGGQLGSAGQLLQENPDTYGDVHQIHLASGGGQTLAFWEHRGVGDPQREFALFDGAQFGAPTPLGEGFGEDTALAMNPSGDAVAVLGRENDLTAQRVETAEMAGEVPRRPAVEFIRLADGVWSRPDFVLPDRWGENVEVGIDAAGNAMVLITSQRPDLITSNDVIVDRLEP